MVVVQCCAITRAGRRCSITSASTLRDRLTGRLAAAPLLNQGKYCLFHATVFSSIQECGPRSGCNRPPLVVYLDLETTSLDTLKTEIVELGAIVDDTGAAFASLVRPREGSSATGERIHGITADELSNAPPFQTVLSQFLRFLQEVASPFHRGSQRNSRIRYAVRDDPVNICA